MKKKITVISSKTKTFIDKNDGSFNPYPMLYLMITLFTFSAHAGIWLKGDLHVHSIYGGGDSHPEEIVGIAKKQGLDFVAVTEHDNKMNGIPLHWAGVKRSQNSNVIMLYAMEWTTGANWFTSEGHANLFFNNDIHYEKFWLSNVDRDVVSLVTNAEKENAILSLNHPALFGFSWELLYPKNLKAIEVWNGNFNLTNSSMALEIWQAYLNSGAKVTGLGGSDIHDLKKNSLIKHIASPTTWVYAKEKKYSEIMMALKNGKAVITSSPQIAPPKFEISAGGKILNIGEELSYRGKITINISGSGLALLKKNGKILKSILLTPKNQISVIDQAKTIANYRMEIYDEFGNIKVITNPIYLK